MLKNSEAEKKTVLVVEDRENWRTTFCNLLSNMNYHVLEATCGQEFKEKAPTADVIILDISMPIEPDGEEVKTAGLDMLIELQKGYPKHPGIQNPIVRSMWEKEDFIGTKYKQVKVSDERWCSRNITSAELINLIETTPAIF